MTRKERNDLFSPIETAANQLIDEIERMERNIEDANEIIDDLEDEIDTLNARIKELEEAQS